MHALRFLATAMLLSLPACRSSDAATVPPRAHRVFERTMEYAVGGEKLSYRLYVPVAEMPTDGWPLLLFLHGAGERGTDLSRVEVHGPPKVRDEVPELRRCVIVAPQCPADSWWRAPELKVLLDEVRGLGRSDARRIYVTGLSMGGFGTWSLLSHYPDLFAAAIPICGGGKFSYEGFESDFDEDGILRATDVPIRAFHGDADAVVPLRMTLDVAGTLEEVGGDVDVTVYPGVGHDSWTQTYADPEVWGWLFAQQRDPMPSATSR